MCTWHYREGLASNSHAVLLNIDVLCETKIKPPADAAKAKFRPG